VTSLIGGRTKPYSGDAGAKAKTFLTETALVFGLKKDLSDLNIIAARVTPFSTNVEFQQGFDNRPVENGRLQVNFDKEGRLVQVVNSYAPPVNPPQQDSLSKEQTIEIAKKEFLRTTPVYKSKVDEQKRSGGTTVKPSEIKLAKPIKVEDVYFIRKDQLRRAHKTFIHADKPFGIKQIISDAHSGEILQIRNFVYTAGDRQSQVFNPNPVASLKDDSLEDHGDRNDAIPSGSPSPNPYHIVSLEGLEDMAAGTFSLKGPFVVLEDREPPTPTFFATSSDDFMFQRESDEFEDVMVYFHVDRIQRYIQFTLKFDNVMNRPISADAHGGFNANQSHYVSSPDDRGNGYLSFGVGGVDDAEDADVIAHEYGHAIQDNQTLGKYEFDSSETRAMAEGFGDYWAVSTDENLNNHDLPCVAEWDNAKLGCLRRVDKNVNKDDFDENASPHVNGEIWSATLFDIFKALGKDTADRLILHAHFHVPYDPTFVQGADSIIAADWCLFGGVNIPRLCELFRFRKIYGEADCPSVPPPSS
jgi:hypothetical protein